MDTSSELMEAARTDLKHNLRQNCHRNSHEFRNTVIHTLKNFFYQTTKSHPVILPNIVHV
jgi:mRNA degradation ribonuclease J1/J2